MLKPDVLQSHSAVQKILGFGMHCFHSIAWVQYVECPVQAADVLALVQSDGAEIRYASSLPEQQSSRLHPANALMHGAYAQAAAALAVVQSNGSDVRCAKRFLVIVTQTCRGFCCCAGLFTERWL